MGGLRFPATRRGRQAARGLRKQGRLTAGDSLELVPADPSAMTGQDRTSRMPRLIMLPSNGAHASTVHRPPGPDSGLISGW